MEILHELAGLFLQAVPTVVLVFLFYLFMRWAFFTPIQKAMAERDAKIEGARRQAAELEAEAARELQDYNERLRKVRAEIYAEQEGARQVVLEERARLLKAMRSRALEEVVDAKKKTADDLIAAGREVALQTDSLAAEIVRTILESPLPTQGAGR